ncbi:MAG TPA: DUF3526 domain-containing protein [Chitinophaga sp.]|uniref:DUF3526 domain-containing protein n=1 Tax=Chitinophaga sp. TaxID=1869181 RepID=UPI002F9416AD
MHKLNRSISVAARILQFELRSLTRGSLLPALAAIFILAAAVALYYGRSVMVMHKAALDSIQQDYHQQYIKLYKQLDADTSTAQGKTDYIMASHPAVVDYRLHRTVFHPPAPLSLLAIGMSDMATYYFPVTIKQSFVPAEEKINNPEYLLSGNFDGAFLLIYLLPLAAICLSYNLLAQEKEQGTLALLVIQKGSITGTLLLRLLLRYLILLIAVLLITITGICLSGGAQVPWQACLAWMGVCAAYTALWMAIIWFILSWNTTAAANLVILLCTWLLLLVVIPALFRLSMPAAAGADDTATYASRQREIEWDTWELPQKQLLDSFYAAHPQYYNQQAYDTSAASSRRLMAYFELVAKRMQRVMAGQETARRRDMQAVTASYYYNPAVYTQTLLNSIARTDITDYAFFNRQANVFREQWKQFFYRLHFNGRKFTAADYKNLPAYKPVYDANSATRWWKGTAYLLLLTAGWLLAGIAVLWKRHVRHDH